ncbi:hypothetical protein MTQ10_04865 [Streptomyces sp. XM83C]|jgi:hypothetical protein|uniref:hypothetical protein n=1 Tax=unclassified Streptomyces TaxID=2593676 RepID=UPI001FFA21FF|nr:hypothetical protein [Streptomyces sp. XM83C]MCK1818954.1 hypothetical protein [Streptomyces sp. XM83C]
MDISGTPLRALRAALFTALVVTLGTASHVLLSRVPLPLNTVAAVAAGVFVLAYALAGRERGFGRIAAVLVPVELTADTVLTTGQHVCYGPAGGPVTGPLHSVGWNVLCGDGTGVGTPLTRLTGTGAAPAGGTDAAALLAQAGPATAWLLLAAHVSVGLIAAAWLWRGERALARLVRAAGVSAFRPLLLAVASVTVRPARQPRRLPRPVRRTAAFRGALLAHSPGRRGPPRSAVFA